MNDFWTVITQIFAAIFNFLDWYIEDTPLFKDTLDAIYAACLAVGNSIGPLIAEYIDYILQYINR